MTEDEGFRVSVKPIVTLHGLVLVIRSEEGQKWRFPDIELDTDEGVDRAAEKGVKDLLGLEVEPHQLIDAVNTSTIDGNYLELYLHMEAGEKDIEADDREAKWIDPEKLDEYLVREEVEKLDRREISNFVRKLKSMPSRGEQ